MPQACVFYSDIVEWSKGDFFKQIRETQGLSETLVQLTKQYGLHILWKTSTGDGFAVAFPREDAFRVLQLCANLLDQFSKEHLPEVRLAIAAGDVESFWHPLLRGDDYTGHAIIEARRILDGITASTVLLVQKSLAKDTKGRLPEHVVARLVDHPPIHDKHGDRHDVVRLLPHISKEQAGSKGVPPSLQQAAELTKSLAIINTEKHLGTQLQAIDGILIMWMVWSREGIPSVAVRVEPTWRSPGAKESIAHLVTVGGLFKEHIARHWERIKAKYGDPNNPKIWLKGFKSPLADRPSMTLEVGRTDFWSVKCLEEAFKDGSLLEEYESGKASPLDDTLGLTAVVPVLLTNDDHLILAQRKGGEVDFAGGAWTATFEEHWNPLLETLPYDTVLRGLKEEFNIDLEHGVHVGADNVELYAVGREWGDFYNTVLIYVVQLPASARKVLECWQGIPPPQDKNEHAAVAAVPLTEDGRTFLTNLISMKRSEKLSVKFLKDVCGSEKIVGMASDGVLHPTHTRARIIMGLFAKGYY